MASHQAHDIGFQKRKAAEPIRRAALARRLARRVEAKTPPRWFQVWLRTNRYPTHEEFAEWEASLVKEY